jgi:CheY-like chemotaxis protein
MLRIVNQSFRKINRTRFVLPLPSGQAAVSLLEKSKSIRLLIVDFTMPEMNGEAVVKELRKSRPNLPVLLITGSADLEAIQDNLPDVAMLLKRFDHEVLTRRVGGMLEAARTGAAHPVA